MKKKTALAMLLSSLVFVIILSMSANAFAARPASPSEPAGKKGSPPGDGNVAQSEAVFIYAGDPGWVTEGEWYLERYTQLPPPLTGEADLLVANDEGATATYAIPAGYRRMQVASCLYWNCGVVEVFLDGILVKTSDLMSETTVWGQVVYTNARMNPRVGHTLTIRATGKGGPGPIEAEGVTYDFHFVNVQYLRLW